MNRVDRLVVIADFLDKNGLQEEANQLDKLIKEAAEGEKSAEKTEPTTEDNKPAEDLVVEDDMSMENELEELKKEKQTFIKLFYRDLIKTNQKLQKTLDSEEFGYLGQENVLILKDLYSALMKIMKKELNSIGTETEAHQTAGLRKLALDKKKVLKDVKQIFLPTIKMYEEFEEWLVDHPDFANNLIQTQKTFLNLKNVISNVIENVSEAIIGVDLVS